MFKYLANVWTLLVCICFSVVLEHLSLFLLHRQLAAPGRHATHTSAFSLPSSWSPSVWPNLPTPSTHYIECVHFEARQEEVCPGQGCVDIYRSCLHFCLLLDFVDIYDLRYLL